MNKKKKKPKQIKINDLKPGMVVKLKPWEQVKEEMGYFKDQYDPDTFRSIGKISIYPHMVSLFGKHVVVLSVNPNGYFLTGTFWLMPEMIEEIVG